MKIPVRTFSVEPEIADGSTERYSMAFESVAKTSIKRGSTVMHNVADIAQKAITTHSTVPPLMTKSRLNQGATGTFSNFAYAVFCSTIGLRHVWCTCYRQRGWVKLLDCIHDFRCIVRVNRLHMHIRTFKVSQRCQHLFSSS